MAVEVLVVDTTKTSRTPVRRISLQGKFTKDGLRKTILNVLGIADSLSYCIEIKDEHGQLTKQITSRCVIFVKANQTRNPFSDLGDIENFLAGLKK